MPDFTSDPFGYLSSLFGGGSSGGAAPSTPLVNGGLTGGFGQLATQPATALGTGGVTIGDQGTGSGSGLFGITGLGANLDSAKLGLSAFNSLGSAWSAYQANKLATDSFNSQKQFANANLNNQIKSYNTQLTDRATSRAAVNGSGDPSAYIAANQLSR